jgi:FAD/FMN-containing dehydrogenase
MSLLISDLETGLGGNDGSISIDLQVPDFQYVYLNNVTGQATIGSGSRLLEIDKELHDLGKRTFPHGICPGVGIGGHATVVSYSSLLILPFLDRCGN